MRNGAKKAVAPAADVIDIGASWTKSGKEVMTHIWRYSQEVEEGC